MLKQAIRADALPPPVGPCSPAIRSGEFIILSGQVGVDPTTGKLVGGGVEAEARQIFSNLKLLLEAAGKSLDDAVRAGVFLTDIADFAAVNTVYAAQFEQPFPARTTVGVAALPLGAKVEIELIVKD